MGRRWGPGLRAWFVPGLTVGSHPAPSGWIEGGDTSLVVVLGAVALVLLLVIVVPGRRQY